MTHQVYAFEPPERFVAGTVGPPGERTFFLQARDGGRLVSVGDERSADVRPDDAVDGSGTAAPAHRGRAGKAAPDDTEKLVESGGCTTLVAPRPRRSESPA
jgi:hypothetical protein